MSEELMITKEDLVNWLNRPPSNDDLDLIGFITTRLENFYKLEQENKQLKEELKNKPDTKWTMATKDGKEYTIIQSERIDMQVELNKINTKLFNQLNNKDSILTELEEWLKDEYKKYSDNFISNIVDEEYSYFDSNLTDFDRTATIIDIVKKMDKETLDKIQELKEKYK